MLRDLIGAGAVFRLRTRRDHAAAARFQHGMQAVDRAAQVILLAGAIHPRPASCTAPRKVKKAVAAARQFPQPMVRLHRQIDLCHAFLARKRSARNLHNIPSRPVQSIGQFFPDKAIGSRNHCFHGCIPITDKIFSAILSALKP